MKKHRFTVNSYSHRREFLTNLALGGGTGMLLGARLSAEAQPKLLSSPKAPGGRVVPEIKDIRWRMGPPLPWPCKGQAQSVIAESLIGTGGAQLMQKLPPEFNHRRHPELTNQHVFEGTYMPWGRGAWRLDTRTLKYEILPPAPVGFHWPLGVAVGRDFYVLTGYIRPADERDREKLRQRVKPGPASGTSRATWMKITPAGGSSGFPGDPVSGAGKRCLRFELAALSQAWSRWVRRSSSWEGNPPLARRRLVSITGRGH